MKKCLKRITTALTITLAATLVASTAIASPFQTILHGRLSRNIGAVGAVGDNAQILYMTINTPSNQPINLDEFQLLVGTSSTSPCSDLSIWTDLHSSSSNPLTMGAGNGPIGSADLVQVVGAHQTCFEMNFIANGKVASTGQIKLTGDADIGYVAASPNNVTINIG
jgi:hypothetical protein